VRGSRANRPLLVDDDVMTALGELPRRLASRESTSDDMYGLGHSHLLFEGQGLGARC
jgi:hypothetical protein